MTTMTTPQSGTRRAARFRQLDQAVKFGFLDARLYSAVRDDAPVIDETIARVNQGGTIEGLTDALFFDSFNLFNRAKPEPSSLGSPLLQEVVRRVMASADYAALHAKTMSDEVASAMATCSVCEKVVGQFDADLKDKAKREAEAQKEAADAKGYAEMLDESEESSPEEQTEAWAEAEAKKAAHSKARGQLNAAMKRSAPKVNVAVKRAMAEAKQEVEAYKEAGESFGVGNGVQDPIAGLPVDEKFRLAKIVQSRGPAFRELLKTIGRVTEEAMRKQAQRVQHDAGEYADLSLGSDIGRIVDDEIVALRIPALRAAALGRLVNDSMTEFDVVAKETLGKGDVRIYLDESGSMQGQPEAEAKAIAIAFIHVAMKQKRRAEVAFFQGDVTHRVSVGPDDAKVVNGVCPAIRKLVEIAERGTGGGTEFDPPYRDACDYFERSGDERRRRADVLVITDGAGSLSEATIQRVNNLRQREGVRFWTMLIGSGGSGMAEIVAKVSDKVWSGDALLKSGATELFSLV